MTKANRDFHWSDRVSYDEMMRRICDKVAPMMDDRGCWEWIGKRHGYAKQFFYGALNVFGKEFRAHRVSWELHIGPIPDGLEVCHRCDNGLCVNPGTFSSERTPTTWRICA